MTETRLRDVIGEWTLAWLMILAALIVVPVQIWGLIVLSAEAGWFMAAVVTIGVWIVPDFGLFGIFLPATVIQAVETYRKYRDE